MPDVLFGNWISRPLILLLPILLPVLAPNEAIERTVGRLRRVLHVFEGEVVDRWTFLREVRVGGRVVVVFGAVIKATDEGVPIAHIVGEVGGEGAGRGGLRGVEPGRGARRGGGGGLASLLGGGTGA